MALAFHRSFDLPVSVLRPFNTFGPRQSAQAVIPTVIGQIASGQKEIKLGSLHPTRDFTFVLDTARLHSNNEYRSLFRRGGQYRYWS